MLAKIVSASASAAAKLYVEDVFSTWLYTGTSSTQTITNGIDLAGKGGLVWLKSRSQANVGGLFDTARGAGYRLAPSATNAQDYTDDYGYISNFGSSGFTLASPTSGGPYNATGSTNVSWTFRKAAKFFDVVTFTVTNGYLANRRISHSLGAVPGTIIVKCTSAADSWYVYHRSLGRSGYLTLNSTGATTSTTDAWGTSDPTSTDFGFNEGAFGQINQTYVAYIFAHDAGGFGDSGNDSVVSCGSFTTDGSGNATVNLGWEPQWVMMKASSTTGWWNMYDTMRGYTAASGASTYNLLFANSSNAEASGASDYGGVTSTGFTVKQLSASATYIYIAIRRGPMKTPTDATKVLKANTRTGTGANTSVTGIGFTPDLVVTKTRTTSTQDNAAWWFDRLRGNFNYLISTGPAAENFGGSSTAGFALAGTTQETASIVHLDNINRSGDAAVDWFFRRAPGFFDVVAYTGNGSSSDRNITHNLQVRPEMAIVKCRSSSAYWPVWHKAITGGGTYGTNYNLGLNTANGKVLGQDFSVSGNTDFTASTFPVMNAGASNSNGATYIAYLFASCPGVSSVGSYTGTGTTLSVDCGFTNGARFVLIKRIDSTGDWYVWDTARGIVSGNDPYLLLNSLQSEVTNTDYIDPLSSGFQISSTAPAAINANGGTFLYLAIA